MKVAAFLLLALPLALAGLPRGMDMDEVYKMMARGSGYEDGDDGEGGWKGEGGEGGDDGKMDQMMKWMMEMMGHDGGDGGHSGGEDSFMAWMKKRQEQQERERKEKELKKYLMEFQNHLKEKKRNEYEIEKLRKTLVEKAYMIEAKKNMTQKLHNVSTEFMKKKLMFIYGVTSHFLDFCSSCSDGKNVLERMHDGKFGMLEYSGHNDDMGYDNDDQDKGGDQSGGEMDIYKKPSQQELYEFVKKFAHKSHEEQVKYVMHDLIKVMCGAAEQFFSHLRLVEHYLIEYRRKYDKY